MNMKKMIGVILTALLFLSSVVACSQESGENEKSRIPHVNEPKEQIVKKKREQKEPEPKEQPNTEKAEEDIVDGHEPMQGFENEAFRIYEPTQGNKVENGFVVRGEARVYEATVQYELLDENENIIAAGFTTASIAAPEWGEFSFVVNWENNLSHGTLLIFEENAEDGSKRHTIKIPIKVE
jgi:hypothetical protein